MAGGKGERFWPQSRLARPKHLLPIVGKKPMIAETLERAKEIVPLDHIFVITNSAQVDGILAACTELKASQVIGEPIGRDTAPAIALATALIKSKDPAASFIILPADHVIKDKDALKNSLNGAFHAAESGNHLVTIGIKPLHPATGYGYIKQSSKADAHQGINIYNVDRFVEKPDITTAQEYLDSGQYLWNAGMFAWTVPSIEAALQTYTPALYQAFSSANFLNELSSIYPDLEKISIDYAILEKASNVLMVESTFDWDDAGEWLAIERHLPQDAAGNTIQGSAITIDALNNIIISPHGHTAALMGISDMIVVNTGDATLICRKDDSQNIKKILQEIQQDISLKHLI